MALIHRVIHSYRYIAVYQWRPSRYVTLLGRFLGGWLAGLVVGGFWVGGLLLEAKGAA